MGDEGAVCMGILNASVSSRAAVYALPFFVRKKLVARKPTFWFNRDIFSILHNPHGMNLLGFGFVYIEYRKG
jgi:hypothetical protein